MHKHQALSELNGDSRLLTIPPYVIPVFDYAGTTNNTCHGKNFRCLDVALLENGQTLIDVALLELDGFMICLVIPGASDHLYAEF